MRAKSKYFLKHYKQAINDFNKAIRLFPEFGDYYLWRSKTYSRMGQFKKAMIDIKQANNLNLNDGTIQKNMKSLFSRISIPGIKIQDKNEAVSEILTINNQIKLAPNNTKLLYQKAKVQLGKNKLFKAQKTLEKAIKLSPDNFHYYLLLDHALFKQNKLNKILAHWKNYLHRNKNDKRAYMERAGTYFQMKKYKQAMKDAKKAMELGHNEAEVFYKRLKKLNSKQL